MAELMGTPSDFEAAQLDLMQRRGRYAKQQELNMPGPGQMVGNRFVATNPLNYLAEMLRGYGAKRGEEQATEQLKDIQGKRQTAVAEALRNFGEKSTGAPARPTGQTFETGANEMGDEATTQQQWAPARAPDLRGAYADLMQAPDPALRQAGMQGIIQMPQLEAARLAKEEERQFRRDEAAATRQARMDELKMRLEDQQRSQTERLAAQKELRELMINAQKENRQLMASLRPERQAQIIQTDAGPMQFVNGQAVPIMGPGGVPVKGKAGPEKEPTEGERKAGTLLQRLRGSQEQLSTVLEKNPSAASPNFVGQALSGIGAESLGNLATSADRQRVNAAQLDMLDAALTLGTGAAYTKEQLEGYRKSYFPQIGDSAATIADKQARLKNVISAAELAAGRTADKAMPKAPATTVPAMTFDAAKEQRYQQWLKSQGR